MLTLTMRRKQNVLFRLTCEYFDITDYQLAGKVRNRIYVDARKMFLLLFEECIGADRKHITLHERGLPIKKSHCMVKSYQKSALGLLETNEPFRTAFQELRRRAETIGMLTPNDTSAEVIHELANMPQL